MPLSSLLLIGSFLQYPRNILHLTITASGAKLEEREPGFPLLRSLKRRLHISCSIPCIALGQQGVFHLKFIVRK